MNIYIQTKKIFYGLMHNYNLFYGMVKHEH